NVYAESAFYSFSLRQQRTNHGTLIPFFLQQEVPDIAVLDSIAAHIKLIQGDNVLGKVVADSTVDTKLPLNGLLRSQQIGHLNIQLLPLLFADKIDFFVAHLSHRNRITPAQQFHIDNVFQNQVDIPQIAAKNRLPYAVICYIVFFVDCKDFLALYILSLDLIK